MSLFHSPLRPPGAVDETLFTKLCVRCGQCMTACPYGAVELGSGFGRNRSLPSVDPRKQPCWLCMKCPPSCPTGALDPELTDLRQVHMGRAYILKDRCHNYTGGIMCWTCYDRCPLRGHAIVLEGGLTPAITTACTGCGVCEYVCPIKAVKTVPEDASVPASALPTLKTGGA